MTWQTINVPGDSFHWINPDLANGWLQYVLVLTNPNPPPQGFRAAVSDQGSAAQLQLVQHIYQSLEYFYRAIDLPAYHEPVYRGEFEAAYGKELRWNENMAWGVSNSGWMEAKALESIQRFGEKTNNLQAKHIAGMVLPNTISAYAVRASVNPDSVGSGVYCAEPGICNDSKGQVIPVASSWNLDLDTGNCETSSDWRCIYWQSGGQIIFPALVWSVDLAWNIASKLAKMNLGDIVAGAASHSGLPLVAGDHLDPNKAPTSSIPNPPMPPYDVRLSAGKIPFFGHATTPPMLTPPTFTGMPMQGSPGSSSSVRHPVVTPASTGIPSLKQTILQGGSQFETPVTPPVVTPPSTGSKVPMVAPLVTPVSATPGTPSTPAASSAPTGTTGTAGATGTGATSSTPNPATASIRSAPDYTLWWVGGLAALAGGVYWYQNRKKPSEEKAAQ